MNDEPIQWLSERDLAGFAMGLIYCNKTRESCESNDRSATEIVSRQGGPANGIDWAESFRRSKDPSSEVLRKVSQYVFIPLGS